MSTLATLEQVKEWAGIAEGDDGSSDALFIGLLKGATQFVYKEIGRTTFAKREYSEYYDGYGQNWMVLRQSPPLSILAASAVGIPYAAATGDGISNPFTSGYALLQDRLTLFGQCFPRQRSSVFVNYEAGYYVTDETHTVPAASPYTVQVDEFWLEDGQVTLDDGTLLTKVTGEIDNATQYTVADGLYTFNEDLAELGVLISYSYCPADINRAVIELVVERFKYKDRIGYSSKTLGGQETVAFSANRVPDYILGILNQYKRVTP